MSLGKKEGQNHRINCFWVSGDGLISLLTAQVLVDGLKHIRMSQLFLPRGPNWQIGLSTFAAWDKRRIGQILGYLVLK